MVEIRKKLSEKNFETHFCENLKDFVKRDDKLIDKDLHIDFELFEKFLKDTQEETFNELKELHPNSWKQAFKNKITEELKSKRLVEIIQNGITIEERFEFKLIYTKSPTSFNKELEKKIKSNIFSYSRQYHFSRETNESIDVVLFLNGMPIITIELKYKAKGQTVYDAMNQYIDDRNLSLEIFNLPFLHVASDEDEAYVTTTFRERTTKDFMPFNQELENPISKIKNEPYRTGYLYHEVFTPNSILDLLRNFIFVDKDDKLIFPRFHQRRAVHKITNEITKKFKKDKSLNLKFLIEHSAGSGKSKTITWTSEILKNLYVNDEKVLDSIIIVTDRIDLNKQIKEDFEKLLGKDNDTIEYASNSKDLATAIKNKKKLIVVILHNFKYIKTDDIGNQKNNKVCFIIDEAHRSQGGKLHSSMNDFFEKIAGDEDKNVYPNSVFIGFTATPSDQTRERFGTLKNNTYTPFDVYSMDQAIKEGYILDVSENVIPFRTLFKLREEVKDPLFDKEYHALTLYKQVKRTVFENPDVIKSKISLILSYFKDKVDREINGKAKSMIVTTSRKAAIAYKVLLDREIKSRGLKYKTLVAFSGKQTNKDVDLEEVRENDLNKIKQDIKEEFKKDEYRFLIVADKYQTGFDQPLLFAMFLDKSIANPINAVQTLSRLNRTCPGKNNLPITVDFSNSYELIGKAFDKFMSSKNSNKSNNYKDLEELYINLLNKNIFTAKSLEDFRAIVELDKDIFQTKYELFQNKLKDIYLKKDKISKTEFRQNLGKFSRSFDWIDSIINISNKDIATLGLFATQLYNKLGEDSRASFDIKQIISKIQLEKFKIAPVKISENKTQRGGKKKASEHREVSKLSVNEIIELLGDAFSSYSIHKDGKKIFEEYLKTMVDNETIRKKILNTPKSEIEQNNHLLLKDLKKEISEYLFNDHYEIYEKLKDTDIFNQTNLHLIELIGQDR